MRFIGRLPPEECQETSLTGALLRPEGLVSNGIRAKTLLTTLSILSLIALPAAAATNAPAATNPAPAAASVTAVAEPQLVNSPLRPADLQPDYSKSTDHELTRLGARWDVLSAPEREARQLDGRLRRWARISGAGGRYLRVVLLADGETVHNAFFDRNFRP